jgi:hypothetical protein
MVKRILTMMLLSLTLGLAGTAQAFDVFHPLPPGKPSRKPPACRNPGLGSGAPPPAATVTVTNSTGADATIHLGFLANSCYQIGSFSSFCTQGSNQYICTFPLASGASQTLNFTDATCEASFALAVNQDPWQGCSNSFAELTLHDYWSFNNTYQDTYDVTLVNGFSFPAAIVPSAGKTASATSADNNQRNIGVYPLSCTTCTGLGNTPCAGDASACKSNMTLYPCQDQQPSGADYTVTFNAS